MAHLLHAIIKQSSLITTFSPISNLSQFSFINYSLAFSDLKATITTPEKKNQQ